MQGFTLPVDKYTSTDIPETEIDSDKDGEPEDDHRRSFFAFLLMVKEQRQLKKGDSKESPMSRKKGRELGLVII